MTRNDQIGTIILLTGISGSGKTTLGKELKNILTRSGERPAEFIDGDDARHFLDAAHGFTPKERTLVTKQIAYAAHLLSKNGINVIVANIAGDYETRDYLRKSWKKYIQVFLDADVNDCIKNDPKGIYKRAMQLKQPCLNGLDIPYDRPRTPDVTVNPYKEKVEESLKKITAFLKIKKVIQKTVLPKETR